MYAVIRTGGKQYRVAEGDVLRIESTPREGTHMELLTFYFPDVDGLTGELVMHWGTTVVPIAIDPAR